jgi:phospholipid/cholesterol/gamma-HCH transport system ATP-binding protein
MKTVFDIGDQILFIYEGNKWWEGKKEDVRHIDNPELKAFINASYFQ